MYVMFQLVTRFTVHDLHILLTLPRLIIVQSDNFIGLAIIHVTQVWNIDLDQLSTPTKIYTS